MKTHFSTPNITENEINAVAKALRLESQNNSNKKIQLLLCIEAVHRNKYQKHDC